MEFIIPSRGSSSTIQWEFTFNLTKPQAFKPYDYPNLPRSNRSKLSVSIFNLNFPKPISNEDTNLPPVRRKISFKNSSKNQKIKHRIAYMPQWIPIRDILKADNGSPESQYFAKEIESDEQFWRWTAQGIF